VDVYGLVLNIWQGMRFCYQMS